MSEWISLKEAARRMGQNEKKLRLRHTDGRWMHYPQLARIQEAPGCSIKLIAAEVNAWVREQEETAIRQAMPARSIQSDSLEQQLRALGAHRTMRALGYK